MSTPHRCPICNGNGLVPNGFYNQTSGMWCTTDTAPECCKSCNGKGIVWELDSSILFVQDNEQKCRMFRSSNTALTCDFCGKHESDHIN